MADIGFEEQLEQERIARELEEARKENGEPRTRTRTDPDGTEYEWDVEKKAWFPKIDSDFIAKYQMTYGASTDKDEAKDGSMTQTPEEAEYDYYQNYYQAAAKQEELLSKKKKAKAKVETHDETVDKLAQLESRMQQGDTGTDSSESGEYSKEEMEKYTDEEKKQYNDYWSYYYGTECHDYYSDCMTQYDQKGETTGQEEKADSQGQEGKDQDKEGGKKKGKKRKVESQPARPEGWFEVEESKNTNVYVCNLPLDITDDEFREMMTKYGLVMYDPRTKKPKLKLYRDDKGQPKGDGRCCYIKRESVDLALSILDGYNMRDHSVEVKQATFQMKGDFDVSKKKKKLSNKEKNRLKERQAKLFDWRPEQPGSRPKHEKVVILKNMFDPKSFEDNPLLINSIRDDVREECVGFGEIKKIVVYDRQPDGVISVAYKEAEEADLAVSSLNHRWFAQRRIIAATWDGKTKYEVEETEAEREARLNKWQTFIESDNKEDKNQTAHSNENFPSSTHSDKPVLNQSVPDQTISSNIPDENSSDNAVDDDTIQKSTKDTTVTTEPMEDVEQHCDQGADSVETSEDNT